MWDKVVFNRYNIRHPLFGTIIMIHFFLNVLREFKADTINTGGPVNSFNKKTGKFEQIGKFRKGRNNLRTDVDDMGRPMQRVALLCGPPGLGKTTLAHTIARHAGYSVREINASDDRSPEAFRMALENGTQMKSMLNQDQRPNCIILGKIWNLFCLFHIRNWFLFR